MDFRERIFGQEPEVPRKGGSNKWIAVLLTLILLGVAWHYGIIDSLKDIAISIGNALGDMFSAIEDFFHYALG